MKPLIAIVGNTGVGKSQFAVELAKAFNGEIINCDAMQMYKGLDIITNKHPLNEREGIPHHLLDSEPWSSELTAQDFEHRALNVISRVHDAGRLPILVGGTHYYLQSLLVQNSLINGATSSPDAASCSDEEKVHRIDGPKFSTEQLRILEDPTEVESELAKVDPMIQSKFHPNDKRRLRRALEVWYETGRKPSEIYEAQRSGSAQEKARLRYQVLTFWVWCNRDVLNDRLDGRVAEMIKRGLYHEIESMYRLYDEQSCQRGIWQVIGFKQFLPYLKESSASNWDMCVNAMKAETRQYAKRQTKWIRNKLGPLLNTLGGSFALVDSTDLACWNQQVKQRGINIASRWLNGEGQHNEDLVPEHLLDQVGRRRIAYEKSQWIRFRCDVCTAHRQTEVVLMGEEEWQGHLRSKSHRAVVRKVNV